MKLFLDSANIRDIKEAVSWGVIRGVTTNPTLVAREGKDGQDFPSLVQEIAGIVKGPVSAEVIADETAEMIEEALQLASLDEHIVIKIPMTVNGLKAVNHLSRQGIKTNVTLVYSVNQALLAVHAGASYVSPFIGRLDDVGYDGITLVQDLVKVFAAYHYQTEIIAASIRHPLHMLTAARAGAHIATVPYKILLQMAENPLTKIGIDKFLADWEKVSHK